MEMEISTNALSFFFSLSFDLLCTHNFLLFADFPGQFLCQQCKSRFDIIISVFRNSNFPPIESMGHIVLSSLPCGEKCGADRSITTMLLRRINKKKYTSEATCAVLSGFSRQRLRTIRLKAIAAGT